MVRMPTGRALGQDPDAECADELQHDGARRIGDPARHQRPDSRKQRAGDQAADQRQQDDGANALPSESARRRGADRDAVDQQRAGIVEQAFALEDLSSRCGRLTWRSTAVAAAASGGATMAPSAMAADHGMSGPQRVRDDGHRRRGEPTAANTSAATGSQLSRRSRSEVS